MAPPLTAEGFRRRTDVSRETLDRLAAYGDLLRRWNRSINLVSRASLADLWHRHMLDSAQLAPLLPPPTAGRPRVLVDLGSGAGFPGLVLAILGAGAVHLVEVDRKKAAFLREAARLAAAPVTVHETRIERLAPFAADVVTARAFAPLPRLLAYAAPFLAAGGGLGLFLKGRNVEEELTNLAEGWKMRLDVIPSWTDPTSKIVRVRPPGLGSNRS